MSEAVLPAAHRVLDRADHQLHLVRFRSRIERVGPENDEFLIRCTIPASTKRAHGADGKLRSVIVMLNGFAEADITPYDDLAREFAEHGIASIVLPLPNHFCRFASREVTSPYDTSPEGDPYQPRSGEDVNSEAALLDVGKALIGRLKQSPDLWIDGYTQSMSDLAQLLEHIHAPADGTSVPFLRDFFSPNTRISLYGYSLGGLTALCGVLAMPHLIHSCFVVNSGSSLEDINARPIFRKEWDTLQLSILDEYDMRIARGDQFDYQQEFELVILGNFSRRRQERLKLLCRRILFIAGATDEVFELEPLLRVASREPGIALLQLPAIGHAITSSQKPEWDRWIKFVGANIAAFEAFHPPDDMLQAILDAPLNALADHAPMEHVRAKLYLYEEARNALVPAACTANCQGTWEADLVLPEGKGFCWTVFEAGRANPSASAQSADLTSMGANDYGYDADEIKALARMRVGFVCAMPVVLKTKGTEPAHCVGVVALASDRTRGNTILSGQRGIDVLEGCALSLGEVLGQIGGAAKALERVALRH